MTQPVNTFILHTLCLILSPFPPPITLFLFFFPFSFAFRKKGLTLLAVKNCAAKKWKVRM